MFDVCLLFVFLSKQNKRTMRNLRTPMGCERSADNPLDIDLVINSEEIQCEVMFTFRCIGVDDPGDFETAPCFFTTDEKIEIESIQYMDEDGDYIQVDFERLSLIERKAMNEKLEAHSLENLVEL